LVKEDASKREFAMAEGLYKFCISTIVEERKQKGV